MSGCPSAKFLYSKTCERIKINACGFFCLKAVYQSSNFRPDRTKTYEVKAERNFNDFAISWDPINEIDPYYFYFKEIDYKKTPHPIGPDWTRSYEAGGSIFE